MPTTSNDPTSLLDLLASLGNGIQSYAAPYGGTQNFGAQLLANSGPSTSVQGALGRAMLASQDQSLDQGLKRQQLQAGQLALRNQMLQLGILSNPNAANVDGATGLPIDQSNGDGSSAAAAPQASSSTPAAAPAQAAPSAGPTLADLIQRRAQIGAPSAAPMGAGAIQPVSAAPAGLPQSQPPQLNAPVSSGQFPPGYNPMRTIANAPNWLAPPTAAQISGVPVGGYNAAQLQQLLTLRGGNPAEVSGQINAQQLRIAQQRYAPAIAQLDTVAKSDSPTRYVAADPRLAAAWQQTAPQLGFDPNADFTDQNVRTAFTFARNKLAGALSEATVAPNVPLQNQPTGVGGTVQIDRVTGKVTPGIPQQETASFVMPDGSVRMMTKAAGMRQGLTPYSPETYSNPGTVGDMAALIANYKMAPLNGQALRTTQGQNIMAQVQQINPKYDATQYQTKQDARVAFTSGPQGNTVRSLSVATDHLSQLGQAATALQNGGMPAFNAVANAISRQWGNPAVTSFDAMKEVVGDEVVKAVVGSSGAEGDRDAIKDAFHNASSPAQVQGVIQRYRGLMGSQLNGMRTQYQKATGLNDFNDMLSPGALRLSGGGNGAMGVGQSQNINGFTVTRMQ